MARQTRHWLVWLLLATAAQISQCVTISTANQTPLSLRTKTLFARTSDEGADAADYASPPRPARPTNSGQQCGSAKKVDLSDFGVIESPSYPHAYSAGLDCEWSVEGPPDSSIQATLFDARTQNNLFADVSDSLYLSLSGNWSDSQRYSGDFNPLNPLVLLSDGNRLGVRFRSSPFSTGSRGFKLAYFTTRAPAGTGQKPAVSEPAADVHTAVVCPTVPVVTPAIFPATGQSRVPADELESVNRTNPHPFLVALILDEKQFCSGTLVSARHIITSAHCTKGVQRFELIFGTTDISVADAGVQRRSADASDVLAHPHFDAFTGANDISVIALKENVTFTRFVSRAEVPSWNSIAATLADFRAETVGWGDTQKGTVYAIAGDSDALILPNTFCRALHRGSSGLTMCTRATSFEICQADSGSPVFTRNSNCPNQQPTNPKPQRPKPHKPGKPGKPKPSKPGKPSRPSKPAGKPNRPNRPRPRDDADPEEDDFEEDAEEETGPPVLLGVISHGSCSRGFSITRITAYLDFLYRAART